MQYNRQYFKNLSFSYLPLISRLIGSIFFIPFIFNTLREYEYGNYIIWGTTISYLMFFNLGAPQALTQHISSKNKNLQNKNERIIITSLLGILILVYLLLMTSTFLLYLIIPNFSSTILIRLILIINIFITKIISDVFDSALKSRNQLHINQVVNSASYFIYIGIAIIFLASFKRFGVLFLSQLVSSIFSSLTFYILLKRKLKYKIYFKDFFHFKETKIILKPGVWYFISSVTTLVIFQTDSLSIGLFLSSSAVATYGIVFKYSDLIRTAISNIVNVMFVEVARLKHKPKSKEIIWSKFKKSMLITFATSTLVSIFLFLFGYDLLTLWIDKKIESKSFFNFFIVYIFLFTTNQVPSLFLGALGEHKEIVKVGIIQAILNLALSITSLYLFRNTALVISSTCLSLLVTNYWYNPYILYKKTRS